LTIFNVKNLEEAIGRIGTLSNRDFTLFLWVDNKPDCSPIVKMFRFVVPVGVTDKVVNDIMDGINSKVWILGIMDEHKNIYRLTESEEYAKKACEVKKDGK
jgi:hypothetical protein